jgi:S1-C subfamily serine protease
VIGINTAILSDVGQSAGIGFAVPIDRVNRVVPDLITHGRVRRPFMGIGLLDQARRYLGYEPNGIVVRHVEPESPAARAGLRSLVVKDGYIRGADVIQEINGQVVQNFNDLRRILDQHEGGDVLKLRVIRKDLKQEVEVRLTLSDPQ